MKRARFAGEQIIAVLREHGARAKAADLARRQVISQATLCTWNARRNGFSEAKRLAGPGEIAERPPWVAMN